MTARLRPLYGLAIAAAMALSLVLTAADAMASTRSDGGALLFSRDLLSADTPLVEQMPLKLHLRPYGRFGISWE